jgi:hypothetical protein
MDYGILMIQDSILVLLSRPLNSAYCSFIDMTILTKSDHHRRRKRSEDKTAHETDVGNILVLHLQVPAAHDK